MRKSNVVVDIESVRGVRWAVKRATKRMNKALKTIWNNLGGEDSDVVDMLTDMRHFCDDHGLSFAELNKIAYQYYVAEVIAANKKESK